MADLQLENHGSVCLLRPITEVGRRWLDENVQTEGWEWFGGALACKPSLVWSVIDGAVAAGLEVS